VSTSFYYKSTSFSSSTNTNMYACRCEEYATQEHIEADKQKITLGREKKKISKEVLFSFVVTCFIVGCFVLFVVVCLVLLSLVLLLVVLFCSLLFVFLSEFFGRIDLESIKISVVLSSCIEF
jgi:uncharacterized membrane protein